MQSFMVVGAGDGSWGKIKYNSVEKNKKGKGKRRILQQKRWNEDS